MSDLEAEVEALHKQLRDLAERVRLHAVAERFIAGNHEIRLGDAFLHGKRRYPAESSEPSYLQNISSYGRWTYTANGYTAEYNDRDQQSRHERLYTIAEVAEILARAEVKP